MKGFFAVAGTVVIAITNPTGKERLNLQQLAIVTPRTADALGLIYQNLWDALVVANAAGPKKSAIEFLHGSPIIVRMTADQKTLPVLTGLAATLPLEKAALAADKNVFVRT